MTYDIDAARDDAALVVRPGAVARWLGAGIALIGVLHLLGMVARFGMGRNYMRGLIPLTNLDVEQSFGTWYTGMLWMLAAALMALIGRAKRAHGDRFAWAWRSLAGLCIYLSLDEMLSIHELFNEFTVLFVPRVGPFYWTWVVAGGLLAAIVGIVYLRFLFSLAPHYRWRFVAAAGLFLGGALGFEMIEGVLWQAELGESAIYAFCVLLEETLEQLGILLAIHTALRLFGETSPRLVTQVADGNAAHAARAAQVAHA